MLSLRSAVAAAALASILAPVTGLAQAEPSPFHRGQWGADIDGPALTFFGLGAIRFTAPERAVVLDLDGSAITTTSVGGARGNSNGAELSLGLRRYHGVAPSVELFHTLGIEANYSHNYAANGPTTTNGWGAGVFGDLGAGWMVSPHLMLGARWRVNAIYDHTSTKTPGATTSGHSLNLSFGGVSFISQLFF